MSEDLQLVIIEVGFKIQTLYILCRELQKLI
jgi:hypothetical protein